MPNKKSPWSGPRAPRDGVLLNGARCPTCQTVLDAWTAVEPGSFPKPGDATLCLYCGTMLMLDQNLHLQVPSEIEKILLEAHPDMKKARRAYDRLLESSSYWRSRQKSSTK